ncbi:MAG: hypothetical protein ACREBQ_11030 [Nitrososphaerales archaeon]
MLEHWHGYIGGGVLGFCFELSIKISKKLREWQPSKKILASIFVGGLLFSCFAAWQEQYQEAIEAEKKLEELTKAHLDAEIVMNAADETPTEKTLVYVWMGISNRIGPPSGVWRWIMRLSLNDGRSFE